MDAYLVDRHKAFGVHITVLICHWLHAGVGLDLDDEKLAVRYWEGIIGVFEIAGLLIERELAAEGASLDAGVGEAAGHRKALLTGILVDRRRGNHLTKEW